MMKHFSKVTMDVFTPWSLGVKIFVADHGAILPKKIRPLLQLSCAKWRPTERHAVEGLTIGQWDET